MTSGAPAAKRPPRQISLREALSLDRREAAALHRRHLNPRLLRLQEFLGLGEPVAGGAGPFFWTRDGVRYLDFMSAFGALPFGHDHPRLSALMQDVAALPNLVEGLNPVAAALAHNLCALAPAGLTRVYFANSGTEAVDAAIKLARAATGRSGILACRRSFHGRSIGALSLSDWTDYRDEFEPLLPDVAFVDFGDAGALEDRLDTRRFAAFVVEPIQGEAGVVPAPRGYLSTARRLCSRTGTLFVADEIQTGLGRTGGMLAVDEEGVTPDCLLLGKALGGGIMPLSALLTSNALWRAGKGGTPRSPFHSSTYGANTRACAAGLATLQILQEEGLVEKAMSLGAFLRERLVAVQARQPLIRSVRGKGLMLGIELASPWGRPGSLGSKLAAGSDARYLLSAMVLQRLIQRHRIVTAITLLNADVIRVQPPLNLDRDLAARFVESLEESLDFVSHAGAAARTLPDFVRFLMPRLSIDLFE